ncbi:MAG: LysE family translocator [Caulobacterales bacterium]
MNLPVDPTILIPFTIAVALVELTPGPNMGWLAIFAARHGRAAGMAAVAGVSLGLSVYMAAAAFGIAEIVVRGGPAYEVLRWAGIVYLLWLAWETWTGADNVQPEATGQFREGRVLRHGFMRGLIANLLNPKAAVFYLTILPTFVVAGRASPLAQTLFLGSTHLLVSVLVHGAIVLAAGSAHDYLNKNAREVLVRRIFGLAIAVIAVWLVFATRRGAE